jgi:muramoyltetrapeptide carboxypeptidase LdcA involved in peptidoglycan recycling
LYRSTRVLEGFQVWPPPDAWDGRILFFETSEDKPSVDQVRYWLFNYGVQGVFDQASALIFGRARDYSMDEKAELDRIIVEVVVGEFGARDLTIVTNMDFGHTDPQWILPNGVLAELDATEQTFILLEPAVV